VRELGYGLLPNFRSQTLDRLRAGAKDGPAQPRKQLLSLSLPDCDYKHHNLLIKDLIDQAIASAFQLHFVAIRELAKSIGFYSRILQYLCELLLELVANRIAEFVPLL